MTSIIFWNWLVLVGCPLKPMNGVVAAVTLAVWLERLIRTDRRKLAKTIVLMIFLSFCTLFFFVNYPPSDVSLL
jgi:ABC-type polysaccharide transport system permease subunit